jgi:hypothetical protein
VFSFTIDGLLQRMVKFEFERKGYGTFEIMSLKLKVPVVVQFCVKADDQSEFPPGLRKVDSNKYPDGYYIGWLHFSEYHQPHVHCSDPGVPTLDFTIWLLPEEWQSLKESMLIAKWNSYSPIIAVTVEFPGKPDPNNLDTTIVDKTLYLLQFKVESLLSFDTRTLFKHPVFRSDTDLPSI